MSTQSKVYSASLGVLLSVMQIAAVTYPIRGVAEVSSHTIGEFTQYPILSSETTSVTPMVMINTSNDHQLYYKAYNDFTDLDPEENDGIEITYKHSIDYYGYFDSYKCYDYDSSDKRYEPASITADKYCSGNWSGNFLNWASMSRIDAIRKILFGGSRRTDTSSVTVLERTYLPNDAHSWAKYYAGSDINRLTPFSAAEVTLCNTTVNNSSKVSQVVTDPPLIRVAEGDYSLWASNERWQCRWSEEKSTTKNANDPAYSGLDAASSNPSKSSVGLGGGDFVARVQACVSGLIGEENCKKYPSGYYKPIGLLQIYGENDRLHFGMTGGSYTKNKSGGILIKDIGSITDEIDTSNGTFKLVSSFVKDGGVSTSSSKGIINTWSTWRIVKYRHGDGHYGVGTIGVSDCPWGSTSFQDGWCQNWGNPYAEIFLSSLRYLAGESVSNDFSTDDSGLLAGLNTPSTWDCPLDDSNYCASLNIINFNASVISYDTNDLDGTDGIGGLGAALNSSGLTDVVGAGENIHGKRYFVGENGSDNNQLCTAKTVSSLGTVEGLCSEAPRLDGSYRVAGLAHWAHTNDIRPDSAGSRALPDDQKVDSYAVALASALPQVEIPVPGTNKTVRLLPACRDKWYDSGTPGNCAIVDFKVVQPHSESGGIGTGKFYVNWEDTEQGGDYDQDMWGIISYQISATEIAVTTDAVAKSTPFHMGFGYVISGTTNDGFHVHSGINSFDYTDLSDPTNVPGCNNCQAQFDAQNGNALSGATGPTTATYTIGTSSASLLEDPLYYASKWGGFKDFNDNGVPDLQAEWDNRDGDWVEGNSDGIPDNYFYATNPAKLEEALRQVFEDILSKVASGTAAAVVANSREGQGAIYQALYETEKLDDAESVRWIGTVRAFWIDENGFMREDDGDGVLEATDKAFELCYADNRVKYRYIDLVSPPAVECASDASTLDAVLTPPVGSNSITDLKPRPIWDAGTQLAYKGGTAPGRNIYTWMDTNLNGEVDASEQISLSTSSVDSTNFGYFDVADETAADNLVEFINGTEISGMRSRTLAGVTYLLGDIVNSTPTVVGAPAEAFDLLYQDQTYNTFRKKYNDRRNVVYVGGNDGMLHAFNAGFFGTDVSGNQQFSPGTGETLGEELWAFVPMNLLPHLKWLADPDYTHVFYVDAKPRVFDAKIFPSDTDHPGGWGTVLVVGMRLGGGPMTIDTEGDGLGDADDTTMKSSYLVLDITNPETQPKVIAEISPPNLGYTTSYPTAFAIRDIDESSNEWYLVFGSGPNNPGKAIRDDGVDAGLYIYNLKTKSFVSGYGPHNLGLGNSFVGDPVSVDWNLSFKADALYFGTTGGTATTPTGKIWKMAINKSTPGGWSTPKVFYDAGQPVTPTPSVTWDNKFNKWVFFGTGRMFVEDDQTSTSTQSIYGIRDPNDDSTLPVSKSKLVNVGGVKVYTNNVVTGLPIADGKSGTAADGTVTFKEVEDYINTYDSGVDGPDMQGWYRNMPAGNIDSDPEDEPSMRSFNSSALLGSVLFTSAYRPGDHICNAQGDSSLYGLYYLTGTASPDISLFGLDANDTNGTGSGEGQRVLEVVDLGEGVSSSPSLHVDNPADTEGNGTVTVVTQTGTGSIEKRQADTFDTIKSGEASWREERGL